MPLRRARAASSGAGVDEGRADPARDGAGAAFGARHGDRAGSAGSAELGEPSGDVGADGRGDASDPPPPYVREDLSTRSLHFSSAEIQSRMHLLQPDALALEYTRTMMGFLMFAPQPERIAMIGLGGGSLAKFCHRHLPRTALVAVEVDPRVIALRDAFRIPPDDARWRVLCDDGARFVAETAERFDVLLVDAFDAQGMPEPLGAPRFYDDAFDVLHPGGVFAVNLHAGHPHFALYRDRIRRSFDGQVLRVDDRDGSNSVIFARKAMPLRRAVAGPAHRSQRLSPEVWEQLRGAFGRVGRALDAATR